MIDGGRLSSQVELHLQLASVFQTPYFKLLLTFSLGMYTVPTFTLSRVLGGLFTWVYLRQTSAKRIVIGVVASGMMLGESLGSLGGLFLSILQAPQFGPR